MTRSRALFFILATAPALGFLWGLAEATVFFVVADVLLTLVALFSFRRFVSSLIGTMAGACLGGAVLYAVSSYAPETALAVVSEVPFVRSDMVEAADTDFTMLGVLDALVKGAFVGVPYKVYAVVAPRHAAFVLFLLASIPARFARFALAGLAAAAAGQVFRRGLGLRDVHLLVGWGTLWSAFYALYWNVWI